MPPKKLIKKAKKKTVTEHIANVQAKFEELEKVRKDITKLKSFYIKYNTLMEELLPLFIEVEPDRITLKRDLTVGNKKYRFTPFFYDEKKSMILPKVWKSCAFESGVIE